MQNKKPVALDADGILFDYMRTCVSIVNGLTGDSRASYETATRFYPLKSWGASHLEYAVDMSFEEPFVVRHMPLIYGSTQFVRDVDYITKGNFIVITACPASWHTEREQALEYHFGIDKNSVHFSRDKGIFDVSLLLDDYHQNLNNINGWRLLMDRPWNQDTEGVACRRVFGFDEALCEIDRVYNWNSR